MNELRSIINSEELREAAKASSNRWLDASRWRPVTAEEYVSFLDEIQDFKKELKAPKLPHPKMRGEKYSI